MSYINKVKDNLGIWMIEYISSNNDLQTITTFNPATDKSITYNIHTTSANVSDTTLLEVTHDGVNTVEYQISQSLANTKPLTISTDIYIPTTGNVLSRATIGRIRLTPNTHPTTFTIEANTTSCNLYSESTKSGRKIKTNEGVGIDFVSNTMTIRQSNNNYYGSTNNVITANTIATDYTIAGIINLANTEMFQSSNYNTSSTLSEYNIFESSGQVENCNYLEIPVVSGELYTVSCNAYYALTDINAKKEEYGSTGYPGITISTTIGDDDIVALTVNTSVETAYSYNFVAPANTIYFNLGFGDLGYSLWARSIKLYQKGPIFTYNQNEGTLYIKWGNVAASSNLLQLVANTTTTLSVDASNNIFFNSINCGAQATNNSVVISYNQSGLNIGVNGGYIITNTATLPQSTVSFNYNSNILEFVYMSNAISNTSIVELSNV